MSTKQMFQSDLIDLNVTVSSEEELFEKVATKLMEKEYVNQGYLQGITKREESFPTGLITSFLNIALPHSDTEFVEKPFIYIVRTTQPLRVRQMGDNQEMEVCYFFFLGIKEPTKQVGLLQELMNVFQNEEFVTKLKKATNETEIFHLLHNQWT